MKKTYCGFVAIIGRPNTGKSTLLNQLVGEKVSIISKKRQTTRHRIVGIHTVKNYQIVYVDSPGIHLEKKSALNEYMNKTSTRLLKDVDVVIFLASGTHWTDEDEFVLKKIKNCKCPVILAVNKVDLVKDKDRLLPHLQALSEKMDFTEVVPISAKKGTNLDRLETSIERLLPESPFFYSEEQVTDRDMGFRLAEIIREKLYYNTSNELPYSTTVEIEKMELQKNVYHISALILVEREGQKKIVIGTSGEKLKSVGKAARLDMEHLLQKKVFLQLWVKVKSGWTDSATALSSLGYTDIG
ncbi:MAG: GTPase Era [Proteobacteria bacterium]|nr:GTPase Era [Pseudomonadota bacterium]